MASLPSAEPESKLVHQVLADVTAAASAASLASPLVALIDRHECTRQQSPLSYADVVLA